VHLYMPSRDFENEAIGWVGSPLFPFYLRMGAGLALKTLFIFSLGRWTASRISLATVQSYKFSLLVTTLKSICAVCFSVLVTYVVWSNLMMLQQFLWHTVREMLL
jgi:hypothetical protein